MTVSDLLDFYIEKESYSQHDVFLFFINGYELRLARNFGKNSLKGYGKYDVAFVDKCGKKIFRKRYLEKNYDCK